LEDGHDVTRALIEASDGDATAEDLLWQLTYDELHRIAQAHLRRESKDHTLSATSLVHEAYMRIAGDDSSFTGEEEFFFVAARAIRDILVESARKKATTKRGGHHAHVSADGLELAIEAPAEDMLALDAALEQLERAYPRKHRLVMLRFFSGLTLDQAARVLGISERTAERDWQFARAHLHSTLHEE